MKRPCVVFDIDNTIVQTEWILDEMDKLHLEVEDRWQYFYDRCNSEDIELVKGMKEFMDMLWFGYVYKQNSEFGENGLNNYVEGWRVSRILCTARDEVCRKETEDKLFEEKISYDEMYMRKKDDLRADTDVKRDLLKEISEEYDILAYFDDMECNCKVAKELGILSFKVV